MHRLGDVVEVRLVEAAPVAGALRFELLSEPQGAARGRRRERSAAGAGTDDKQAIGRAARDKKAKSGKPKARKARTTKTARPAKSKTRGKTGGKAGKRKT